MVKERPILFSAPMVCAILEDRKTNTRRIIDRLRGHRKISDFGKSNTEGYDFHFRDSMGVWNDLRESELLELCPYGKVGDRLWVRETWCHAADDYDRFKYNTEGNLDSSCCHFRADGYEVMHIDREETKAGLPRSPWCPSIHMPRWASRITLEITGVRVEKLNEISEQDAIAEGIFKYTGDLGLYGHDPKGTPGPLVGGSAVEAFALLWESINGNGAWNKNPWVWVVKFKRVQQ